METVRIFVKKKDPNPLFKKWLKELVDDAKSRQKMKSVEVYEKALKNLEKYPLTLYSGSDAVILEGFGAKICQILNEKLEAYLKQSGEVDKNLPFKDQVDFLKKRDKKHLEEFLNKVETEFNIEDYEKSGSESESEISSQKEDEEEEINIEYNHNSFVAYDRAPPRYSISVVDNNITIQDILNADDDGEPLKASQNLNDENYETEKLEVPEIPEIEIVDYEPPKKLKKIPEINESEDEFDRMVNGYSRQKSPAISHSPEPEDIIKELEFSASQPAYSPIPSKFNLDKSRSLKRFKTFGGNLQNGNAQKFSTPIARKITYPELSPSPKIRKTEEPAAIDFVDLSCSPEPITTRLPRISERESPPIIDLSQSPPPEDIEMELKTQEESLTKGNSSTPLTAFSRNSNNKFRRSKTFGASPMKPAARAIPKTVEFEDSIDRIIANCGFSPITRVSPIKGTKRKLDEIVTRSPAHQVQIADDISVGNKSIAAKSKLRRSKTFAGQMDDTLELVPVTNFLKPKAIIASPAPAQHFGESDIDRIMAKYGSPPQLPKSPKKPAAAKKSSRNPSGKLVQTKLTATATTVSLKRTQSTPVQRTTSASGSAFATQVQKTTSLNRMVSEVIQEDEDAEQVRISVDDLNTEDYDVILLVDTAETSGKQKSSSDDTLKGLRENNIVFEVRKLNAGDFLWIARHKTDKKKEYVLPYIVERKRLDDFGSSIKDGRFHEQKFRLRKSGIENIVYLIESLPKSRQYGSVGLPFTTLLQAATNTQIHNKFTVKFTESHQHSLLYLTIMTGFIDNIFKKKAPLKFQLVEFESFNKSMVKQRKCNVRETFIKQLLALKGLSVNIAVEIANNFPTPRDLYEKYQELSKEEGEKLLTKIPLGDLKKSISSNISKAIYDLYTSDKAT